MKRQKFSAEPRSAHISKSKVLLLFITLRVLGGGSDLERYETLMNVVRTRERESNNKTNHTIMAEERCRERER